MKTLNDKAVRLPWHEQSTPAETQSRPDLRLVKPISEEKQGRTRADPEYLERMGRWHHRRQRRRNRFQRF